MSEHMTRENANAQEAVWIRIGDAGFLGAEWQCSVCLESWEVFGIFTPMGLGYKECPNCHAKMTGVKQ
jgi:hypothetical protein